MKEDLHKRGRPPAGIDWERVDYLLEAGCSGREIASHLGYHHETLYKNCVKDHKVSFSEYSQKKRESGNVLLKVKQFEIALTGDKSLLIWLGKQRLKQSEKQEVAHSVEVGIDKMQTDDPIVASEIYSELMK